MYDAVCLSLRNKRQGGDEDFHGVSLYRKVCMYVYNVSIEVIQVYSNLKIESLIYSKKVRRKPRLVSKLLFFECM